MRILVVGAGATGGYFGGRLAQAGRDVTFLVRAARAAALRETGLAIKSPLGDVTLTPQIVEKRELAAPYDLILLGLKAYALESAMEDFAPAVGSQSMILPMLNGMRHIDRLVERFGEGPVLGGVCYVASTLDEHGRIVQLTEMQQLGYGERSGEMSARIHALDEAMQGAGFPAAASPHIIQDMWDKWVVLAALGASTCLLRAAIGTIVAAGGADQILRVIDECTAVARASDYSPGGSFLTDIRTRLTAAGSPLTSSMFRDMQQGHDVEADHILGDLVDRARGFGLSTPLLAAAYMMLHIYQRGLHPSA
ncbi:MAG TPA: 2-dehydropantoate 2-reductase [Candidatus Acidoferrales bacterium]|nr:2-dehydropantoate 2-reductase [Candidatus Acidoferrales bacterium]